ncbi:hypothetical protein [Nocardioides convexus]|uniref:hypothetical protein n=1 Tax=Nocardioides convexus TaxID=2712224 RepID=UPI002418645A|nr:hypothetical protein [Nocardioides convexus]
MTGSPSSLEAGEIDEAEPAADGGRDGRHLRRDAGTRAGAVVVVGVHRAAAGRPAGAWWTAWSPG